MCSRLWLRIIPRALGLPATRIELTQLPAVGRLTVSSPALWSPFGRLNDGQPYARQIKPFNFLITCHVRPFGHPVGMLPTHFQLIAPYVWDSRRWLTMSWMDGIQKKGVSDHDSRRFG